MKSFKYFGVIFIGVYALYRIVTASGYIFSIASDLVSMTINRHENYNDIRLSELWGDFYVNIYYLKKLTPENSVVYFPKNYIERQFDPIAAEYFLYPRKIKKYIPDEINKFSLNTGNDYLFYDFSIIDFTITGAKLMYSFPDKILTEDLVPALEPNRQMRRGLVIL